MMPRKLEGEANTETHSLFTKSRESLEPGKGRKISVVVDKLLEAVCGLALQLETCGGPVLGPYPTFFFFFYL